MNRPPLNSATPEWQRPLSPEKIRWLQEKYAELRARRPAIFFPMGEYWDA